MISTDRPAWRLAVSNRANHDLRNRDPPVRERILDALQDLLSDDPHGELRRLSGRDDQARLRVGDWRIILTRDPAQRVLARTPRPAPRARVRPLSADASNHRPFRAVRENPLYGPHVRRAA